MKTLKVGIFGLNRGADYLNSFLLCDTNIVAICDFDESKIQNVKQILGRDVAVYYSFDEFINHSMDIVVIANYFHEHARYIIECFKRNIHILCECNVAVSMSECVSLIRASEQSDSIFMLAENYPFLVFNQEMKNVYANGSLGKVIYAEGEYNHPLKPNDKEFFLKYCDTLEHWRNYLPRAYYVSHSIAPLMNITSASPIRVTALPVYSPFEEDFAHGRYVADKAAIITTINDDGSVFKITGCSAFGAHGNSYRLCGEKGQIENLRGMGNKIMLRYNEWDIPEGLSEINFYEAERKVKEKLPINEAAHEYADFLLVKEFVECVRAKRKSVFDINFAVKIAMIGILAHRSLLEGGTPFDIPNLNLETERIKYQDDHLTPFRNGDLVNTIPCCSNPNYEPSENQMKNYLKIIGKE